MLAPDSISEAEKAAAARWLWYATQGGERTEQPFDLWKEMTSRGISQTKLALRLGCTPRAVRHWCYGTRTPDIAHAYALADIFGLKRHVVAFAFGSKWAGRRRP